MVAATLEGMLSGGVLRRGRIDPAADQMDSGPVISTGVGAIDRVLGRGLRIGVTHEWFGLPLGGEPRQEPGEGAAGGGGPLSHSPASSAKARGGPWTPPLGIVSALARAAP